MPRVHLLLINLTDYFQKFHYVGPFTILFLCGLGFPLPEEVTLIASGIMLYQRQVDFLAITVLCSAAILLGDSIPYWLGRHYGLAALRTRWVAKILHPERFAMLERRFLEHGNRAIFTCRFLPGLRIPSYFVAGTLRMSYARFMLLDSLGVLISVPTSILLGKWFGGSVDQLRHYVHDLHLWLAFGVVSIVLIIFVRSRMRKRASAATGKDPEI